MKAVTMLTAMDFDDEPYDDDEYDDDETDDCGLGLDGQCSSAGTEHCDFSCRNRDSELFVGSAAWERKQRRLGK